MKDNYRSSICLNPKFSTTRLLVEKCPNGLQILPPNVDRKGQGGLRTRGCYKTNYQDKQLITVITVVYNGKIYLEQTILNVINLAYDNIEYIVIDGASEDGSIDLLSEYDDQIDYWVSEPDAGLYDAMNKGWRVASPGSAILYIGAGDKILKLPADCSIIRDHNVIYGQVRIGSSRIFKSRINWQIKFANTLHHQALLIPKALHSEPPFDTRYKIYADYDFNLRILNNKADFKYDQDFLTYALPGGISQIYSLEAYKIAKKNCGISFGILAYLFYLYQKIKRILKITLNKSK